MGTAWAGQGGWGRACARVRLKACDNAKVACRLQDLGGQNTVNGELFLSTFYRRESITIRDKEKSKFESISD